MDEDDVLTDRGNPSNGWSITVGELREAIAGVPDDYEVMLDDADVEALERHLDRYNAGLPPLKDFILPAGGEAAARCHLARTIVRRAEREAVALSRAEAVRPQALRYLNRLSDLLFVLARVLARADGQGEVLWRRERRHAPD